MLLRTSHQFAQIDMGFDPQGVLTVPVTFPPTEASSHDQLVDAMRRVAERVEALPGVAVSGFTAHLPLSGFDGCSSITVAGLQDLEDRTGPCVPIYLVSPGYFETLGIEVVGEGPTWGDIQTRRSSAIMSQALEQRLWPDRRASFGAQGALGLRVRFGPDSDYEIVGTAADVRAERPEKAPTEILYLPIVAPKDTALWAPLASVTLVLRSPSGLPPIQAVQSAIAEVHPRILVEDATSLNTLVENSYVRQTLLARLLGFASTLAFGLACLGVYSIISLRIIHRRTEIGIRMALGATGRRLRRAFVMETLPLVGIGLALGMTAALPATQTIESLLLGVGAYDLATMLLAASLLVLAGCLASWLPAWNATRRLPVESLHRGFGRTSRSRP